MTERNYGTHRVYETTQGQFFFASKPVKKDNKIKQLFKKLKVRKHE